MDNKSMDVEPIALTSKLFWEKKKKKEGVRERERENE